MEKKAENDEEEAEEEEFDEEDIEEVRKNVLDVLNLSYKNNLFLAGKRLHRQLFRQWGRLCGRQR